MTKSANDRQVGGDHYKVAYQHWDMAADCELDYYSGIGTKYISRHRQKNGKEDAEKALHFLEKLRELMVEGRRFPYDYLSRSNNAHYVERFLVARTTRFPPLTPDEAFVFSTFLRCAGTGQLDMAIDCAQRVVAEYDVGQAT